MKLGLLGKTLGHSYSPFIYSALGFEDYSLFEVALEDLGSFLRAGAFSGLNVTIPYKKDVLPYCASLSETAQKAGSVNVLRFLPDGRIQGHNTDCAGFRFMARRAGISFAGKKVLVLGSGGASLSARTVAREDGAGEVLVVSRTGENNYVNLYLHADADILINATPVGMFPEPDGIPVSPDIFNRLSGVLDMVYNPLRTRLVLEAQKRGIPCSGGLPMLVEQARESARIFTGKEIPQAETERVLSLLLRKTENIAIAGMPGCGKTTTGRALSNMLGREFADMDELVTIKTGKTSAALIETLGEAAFRDIEAEVVSEVLKRGGLVIATGGGAPLRAENRLRLRQSCRVYVLSRPVDELERTGRPLSTNLEALQRARAGAYRDIADVTIDAAGKTAEETAALIMEEFHEYTGA